MTLPEKLKALAVVLREIEAMHSSPEIQAIWLARAQACEEGAEAVETLDRLIGFNPAPVNPDPVCPKCGGRQGFPNSMTHHGAIRACWCQPENK